jgi:hypothetical protein
MSWIHLSQNWDLRLALLNVVTNFGFKVVTAVTMESMILCVVMLQNMRHHNPEDVLQFIVMNIQVA